MKFEIIFHGIIVVLLCSLVEKSAISGAARSFWFQDLRILTFLSSLPKLTPNLVSSRVLYYHTSAVCEELMPAINLRPMITSIKDILTIRVIHLGVLTTKPLEAREFQFVYLCSLLSNTQFIP